jgi:C4-dicarboxylate-specific signal transduction histidine kinase
VTPEAPSALARYGYAILSVCLALLAAWILRTFDLEGFIFVIAVATAVWLGGRGPGVVAVALSILILHYFFIAPGGTGAMLPTGAYFIVFSILTALITLLSEARHRAERSLLQARDQLEVKVEDRTAALQRSNQQLRDEIAERQRAEAALRSSEEALAHVTRVTTLGEVSASFAHELNQPLAAIVNNANACLALLPDGRADLDEVRAALGDIVGDAERASAIIVRVRGLAERSLPEQVSLRLADVIADVVALAASTATARGVALRTEVPADLPLVRGDRVQLQQVLLNLVVNGMDAMHDTPVGSRGLEIRAAADSHNGAPAVAVSVRDRGVGLRAEQMDRLFEAFYTTKVHGMGMGLAISRSIIEVHAGKLCATPNPDGGATFTFRLPIAPETPAS